MMVLIFMYFTTYYEDHLMLKECVFQREVLIKRNKIYKDKLKNIDILSF